MNPRIKLISDTKIEGEFTYLNIHAVDTLGCRTNIIDDSGRLILSFDDDGLRTLVELANCKLTTGNFAAIADTSAVPFVGKILRHGTKETVEVLQKHRESKFACCFGCSTGEIYPSISVENLHSLVDPPKKVRPYTIPEVAVFLGKRSFKKKSGEVLPFNAICSDLVGYLSSFSCVSELFLMQTLDEFAENTWADDGSPCGMVET